MLIIYYFLPDTCRRVYILEIIITLILVNFQYFSNRKDRSLETQTVPS